MSNRVSAWWGPQGRGYRIVAGQRRHQQVKRWAFDLARLAYGPPQRRWPNAKPKHPNLLKLARRAHEFTFRGLAECTHISPTRLHRIERELVRPTTDEMSRLSEALGVSCQMLFCLPPDYANPKVALDRMMGFRPFKKTSVVRMVKMLRKELDRAHACAAQPQTSPTASVDSKEEVGT